MISRHKYDKIDEFWELGKETQTLEKEMILKIKEADDKIPESQKYDFNIFCEPLFDEENDMTIEEIEEKYGMSYSEYLLETRLNVYIHELIANLILYLKGDDIITALLKYYKKLHDDEVEREQIRIEREKNELERERIIAYERQEAENRMQQEKFEREREENQRQMEYERRQQEKQAEKDRQALAKQEADWAAARIRCAQCSLYNTCCSMSKNKKPYAPCFKPKN